MNGKERDRRRFLKEGAALAGLAVGAMRTASGQAPPSKESEVAPIGFRPYGERSRFEQSVGTPLSLHPSFPSFGSLRLTPLQEP